MNHKNSYKIYKKKDKYNKANPDNPRKLKNFALPMILSWLNLEMKELFT